jgi:hypothetical protein
VIIDPGELKSLEDLLLKGQRLSMQGSYDRRAPAPEAVPFLMRARDGLKDMAADSSDPRVWHLLSLAHEALLEFGAALATAQEATKLSGRKDKRDLKRIALLRQSAAQSCAMPLSPFQLAELGDYLRDKLAGGTGDRTLRWTETWLFEHDVPERDNVIAALRSRGGYTDFQVLSNVIA